MGFQQNMKKVVSMLTAGTTSTNVRDQIYIKKYEDNLNTVF